MHNLLDNTFTAGDFKNLTVRYNLYNGEPINIDDKNDGQFLEQTSTQPPEKLNDEMEIYSPAKPDILVHPSANEEHHNQEGSTRDQIVKTFLKACFDGDKNTQSKIESQIHTMFPDNSGMF